MKSPMWRSAAFCAVVTLVAPTAPPPGQVRFLDEVRGITHYLLSPGRHQVVTVLPPPAVLQIEDPVPAPEPDPTAVMMARTRQILRSRATRHLGPNTEDLAGEIVQVSGRYDMDPELILAVIQTESSFRPSVRSRAGAVGLMQLLPRTARPLAREVGIPWNGSRTLRDPSSNIRLGIHYLAQLRDRFDGDMQLAISAYNLGPSRVDRYLRRGKRPHWYAGKVEKNRLWLEASVPEEPAAAEVVERIAGGNPGI